MPSPIRQELDCIIWQFFHGKLSYPQARAKIEEAVGTEVGNVKLKGNNEFTYREIVSLGREQASAFDRLKRKKTLSESLGNTKR